MDGTKAQDLLDSSNMVQCLMVQDWSCVFDIGIGVGIMARGIARLAKTEEMRGAMDEKMAWS